MSFLIIPHKSLFAQWSFEEGCLSPLERGSFYNARMLSNEDDIKLIKIAPFTYSYVDTQSRELFSMDGENITNQFNGSSILDDTPTAYGAFDPIFIDAFGPDYRITSIGFIPCDAVCFTQSEVISQTGKYACAVSAMLNCAPWYVSSFDWDNLAPAYNELWSLSSSFVVNSSNGFLEGNTLNSNIAPAFKQYCASKGVSITYNAGSNPKWALFKGAVDGGNMGIFSVGINSGSNRLGHTMTVEGYAMLERTSGISDYIYTLVVADGWYDMQNVNFYYTKYADTYGIAFYK